MIEEGLVQRIVADASIVELIGGTFNRIWPGSIPQKEAGDPPSLPAIVYTRIGTFRDVGTCRTDSLVQAQFQIDSYAANWSTARALARLIRLRLVDFTGTLTDDDVTLVDRIFLSSELHLEDPEPGVLRVSQTYVVWFTEE